MSSSDKDINFKANTAAGHMTKVELANKEFENKVRAYKTLDIAAMDRKRQARNAFHVKTNASRLLKFKPIQPGVQFQQTTSSITK